MALRKAEWDKNEYFFLILKVAKTRNQMKLPHYQNFIHALHHTVPQVCSYFSRFQQFQMKYTSDFVGSWPMKKDLFIMKIFTCSYCLHIIQHCAKKVFSFSSRKEV